MNELLVNSIQWCSIIVFVMNFRVLLFVWVVFFMRVIPTSRAVWSSGSSGSVGNAGFGPVGLFEMGDLLEWLLVVVQSWGDLFFQICCRWLQGIELIVKYFSLTDEQLILLPGLVQLAEQGLHLELEFHHIFLEHINFPVQADHFRMMVLELLLFSL